MPRLKFKPSAIADLADISTYIARDNPKRGLSFVEEIKNVCQQWAENPLAGRHRPDLREGIRCFPHGNYVVFYLPDSDGMTVVRVIHGSRDHRRML